jgi:membrane protease YdiL (CAAX protease family)
VNTLERSSPTIRPVSVWPFFALTFVLSWLIWIPLALSHIGLGPVHIPEGLSSAVRLVGVLMPAAAAIALTAITGGRVAVRRLLTRLAIWRLHWGWWAAATLVYPAVLMVSALLYRWLPGQPALTFVQASPAALLVNIVLLAIATLGEEIGWRGVALPGLQARYSPLRASLILGLVWATWHLPFWVLMDTFDQYGAGYFVLNYLFIVPSTAYLSWIFNRTRSSLLLPVAFHLTFNIVNVAILPVTSAIGAYALFIFLQLLLVVGVSPDMKRAAAGYTSVA